MAQSVWAYTAGSVGFLTRIQYSVLDVLNVLWTCGAFKFICYVVEMVKYCKQRLLVVFMYVVCSEGKLTSPCRTHAPKPPVPIVNCFFCKVKGRRYFAGTLQRFSFVDIVAWLASVLVRS